MLTSDKLQLTIVLTRSLLSQTIFLVIENTPRCYRVWWSRSAIRRYPDVNIARQGLYIQWKRQGIICRQPEIMETIHYVEFWKYIPTNNRPQWCILNGGSVRIFVDNHYWYPYLQTMVQYWYSLLSSQHALYTFFSESHGYQAQLSTTFMKIPHPISNGYEYKIWTYWYWRFRYSACSVQLHNFFVDSASGCLLGPSYYRLYYYTLQPGGRQARSLETCWRKVRLLSEKSVTALLPSLPPCSHPSLSLVCRVSVLGINRAADSLPPLARPPSLPPPILPEF